MRCAGRGLKPVAAPDPARPSFVGTGCCSVRKGAFGSLNRGRGTQVALLPLLSAHGERDLHAQHREVGDSTAPRETRQRAEQRGYRYLRGRELLRTPRDRRQPANGRVARR
jgi:hypothetical protein